MGSLNGIGAVELTALMIDRPVLMARGVGYVHSKLEHTMHPLHRESRVFVPTDVSSRLIYELRGGRCPLNCRTQRGNCNLFALKFPKAVEKPLLLISDILYGGATLSGDPIPCP
jgi:hypothetical protein